MRRARAVEGAAAPTPSAATPTNGTTALPALTLATTFLAVGLLTLGAYGVSWDEPLHREWGRITWESVVGRTELPARLPGEGQYYGPLFYMLSYGVSELAHDVLGIPFAAANHLLTLIAATAGALFTFQLARELIGARVAFFAAILLCTLPPFLAHAHYNPKDIPLLSLATASLLFASRAYRRMRTRDAIFAGACLGWAITMKPTALVLLPVIAAATVSEMLARRSRTIGEVFELTVAGAIAGVLSVFLTWPTLWRDPTILLEAGLYFARGSFWEGSVLYMGELARSTELPWHYTPVMLAVALPLVTIMLALSGTVVLVRHLAARERVFGGVLLLLWLVLPLLLFMKPGLARYDGMRQIFFAVPAIAILGGLGWNSLASRIERVKSGGWLAAALSVAILAWLAAENVRVFPYGGSYVNPVARAALGPHLERSFEIEYWGVAYREGLLWLNHAAEPRSVVCVPVAEQVIPWQRDIVRSDLRYDCADDAGYVMLITRFSEWPYRHRGLASREPIFTVSRYDSALLHVYQVR